MAAGRDSSGESEAGLVSARSALGPFSGGLAADGYSLEVTRSDYGGLRVEIVAGPDACEDCLIPKDMFEGMVRSRLGSEGVEFSDVSVVYPTG